MSRHDSLKWPGTAADVETGMHHPPALDPAVSLAEYAASSAHAPERVGRTLRALAERSFTGGVVFALGAGVGVYLDGGHPYDAVRVGDAPLGERLVAAGLLAEHQLRRGMVRVGEVEHLGRLFDRASSIDRDAVVSATEMITDHVLGEIASADAAVGFTASRHHRSGVHRWFVGPGRTSALRPIDGAAQPDRSPFDVLPDVTAAPPRPRPSSVPPADQEREPRPSPAAAAVDAVSEPVSQTSAESFGFTIVWPDGSEQVTEPPTDRGSEASIEPAAEALPSTASRSETERAVEDAAVPTRPALEFDAQGEPTPPAAPGPPAGEVPEPFEPIGIEMPSLHVDRLPEHDVAVPDDVADAVRRALAAIERASAEPDVHARLRVGSVDLPDVTMPEPLDRSPVDHPASACPNEPAGPDVRAVTSDPAVGRSTTAVPEPERAQPSTPAPQAFPPPTPDMSAEAVYARLAAERDTEEPPSEPVQASIAVVEPEAERSGRTSALQRLVGSLRRG